GVADDGQCTGHEQATQIAVPLFADAAEPVLAPTRVLLGNEPNPGREVTSRSEGPRVSNARDQSSRQHRTDAGNVMTALARLVGPGPGHDHRIGLRDLLLGSS